MKRINILLVFFTLIFACKEQNKDKTDEIVVATATDFSSFGAEIDAIGTLETNEMTKKYQNLAVSDTINTKFSAIVTDVCQAKGCWMKLKLDDGNEAMVKFKDYEFFMPKDISGKKVIVNGLAFIEEMSVDEQKHYAEDGGESQEAIAAITTPKKTYRFEADGVLLKK
tara:strand:+ start:40146 stop:40649 length:504 start_codon:yes stop_codon:yes gene_type:complete